MGETNYANYAAFEHRFWLQILGDHARFIFNALSPKETEFIHTAKHMIEVFDQLLLKVRQPLSNENLIVISRSAHSYANEIREFKLYLLHQLLQGKVSIKLPETFLNHMTNEVEEYLRLLEYIVAGNIPPAFHPVHHHLLWLADAAGHAVTINDSVDPTEKNVRKESLKYTKHFEEFYIKAIEMAGYLRSNLQHFPALSRFNQNAALEICLFKEFLQEIAQLELNHQILGTLSPLIPDHMIREECYYLMKLAQSSEVAAVDCDPTKPRVQL